MALQIVTVCLTAVAMSLALAHALELPGKLRLEREAYVIVQQIYYPGFTIAGMSEGLSIVAALALLLTTPIDSSAFWWTLVGFLGLLAMHAAYWIITHPVNKFWLKDRQLKGLGDAFFAIGPARRDDRDVIEAADLWKRYRDRWEYSHVLRAVLSGIAFVALVIALAIQ